MKRFFRMAAIALGVVLLLSSAGIAVFWEQLPIRLVWPYLAKPAIEVEGTVSEQTIVGAHAGEQTFFLYLPTGYEEGDARYRTLYHLHGAYVRPSWAGYECRNIGAHVEKAARAGIIEPMIVVCLSDPEGDSMWSDSFDMQYPRWTGLTQDLIPHIDATYRTIAERRGRAIQGFSMGGFGATMNAFRSPELFGAVISWDGALHDWQTLSENRPGIASKMFGSEGTFDQWSPWRLTEAAGATEMDLLLLSGTMEVVRDFNARYQSHLDRVGRAYRHIDVDCPHSLFCMMDHHGEEAFAFLAESLSQP